MAAKIFLGVATCLLAASIPAGQNVTSAEHSAPVLWSLLGGSSSNSSSSSAGANLEAALTDLLLGKLDLNTTGPFGMAYISIKGLLENDLMPKVKAADKKDRQDLHRLAKEIGKCFSVKQSALRVANPLLVKYKTRSRSHKVCRADEAIRLMSKTSCVQKQRSLFQDKKLKCQYFSILSRRLGTTKDNVAIVRKAGAEATETYMRRIAATICGKHIHGSKGGVKRPGGWGGGLPGGHLDVFLRAKDACSTAEMRYLQQVKICKVKMHAYRVKQQQCDQWQTLMDSVSCRRAVFSKDVCESFAECYFSKLKAYRMVEAEVKFEEIDRKAEWRALQGSLCLIETFADLEVEHAEIDRCKNATHDTSYFDIKYPKIPPLARCTVPTLYPSTGAYKRAEFAPLPVLAKGKPSAECAGIGEVSTEPRRGSPKSCKCRRVTLNGYYSAGSIVKCSNCLDVRRSVERNSCPSDTKIFSPASKRDWQTFMASAGPLRAPHWIIDITRPQNGCGGCVSSPMNSGSRKQHSWRTSDSSQWWLRNSRYSEPNGDYNANCFLNIVHDPHKENPFNGVSFNDGGCSYHSKSYYCQASKLHLKPRVGSPHSCRCKKVELAGKYSAGMLVKCEHCLSVSKSSQKNSCPLGMKIFSPRSRADWNTFLNSAHPLPAPHWIVDITRPQNGCGGCTRYPMKKSSPQQATWRTADGSPWWLRNTIYKQPTGNYHANCFLGLSKHMHSGDTIHFYNDKCNVHSWSYYCQPKMKAKHRPK